MHITDTKISHRWTALADIIGEVGNDQYVIINSSPDKIYVIEGDSVDELEDVIGVPLDAGEYVIYEKGEQANLYLHNDYTPVEVPGEETPEKLSNVTINKVG